jgi:hypothetical protein
MFASPLRNIPPEIRKQLVDRLEGIRLLPSPDMAVIALACYITPQRGRLG